MGRAKFPRVSRAVRRPTGTGEEIDALVEAAGERVPARDERERSRDACEFDRDERGICRDEWAGHRARTEAAPALAAPARPAGFEREGDDPASCDPTASPDSVGEDNESDTVHANGTDLAISRTPAFDNEKITPEIR